MTFKEKYDQSKTWQEKVSIMEAFHLVGTVKHEEWTISHTAVYFDVSLGLVSENLRLAAALFKFPTIANCETRQLALKKLNGR